MAMDGKMDSSSTLASSIYGRLRRDILTGVFRPTEKLVVEALSERYEVGVTPLREALNRLSAEDIVVRADQRGFRVAPVSMRDMQELMKTLCWISDLGLTESIRNGDAAWEERVVLAAHRLLREPQGSVSVGHPLNPEWERLHRAFHLTLIEACGSRWLVDFYGMLLDRCDRYLYLGVVEPSAMLRDVEAEHRAITDAVLARNTQLAVELGRAHIERMVEVLAKSDALVLAGLTEASP
jgi:DNA-binding GntR family transcriptional regulator